jgi:asparagine synthase (glutamine-hydrolysing)
MCGIAGWITSRPASDGQSKVLARHLRDSILVRGPDGDGVRFCEDNRVGLINTRLAIIDPDARSNQPFVDRDTGAVLVYNGEIYNYRELRAELQRDGVQWETTGDAEVLLKGYLSQGLDFFKRLRGMYAFVIYDPRTREAVALRDPFGIKPLYIRQMDDGVFFGSSARGLAGIEPSCALNPAAAVSFLTLGCIIEPLTCFQTISMASPSVAYIWRLQDGGVQARQIPITPAFPITAEPDRPDPGVLEAALTSSVAAHFEADVEVAVLQSGGLDSTIISTLAARQGFNPVLVTIGFDEFRGSEFDEIPAAKAIAARLGLRHHSVYLNQAVFSDLRQDFLAAMESPTTDAINTYLAAMVCKQAGLKVALSGVGGDELFAGYPSFKRLPRLYRARHVLTAPVARAGVDLVLGRLSASPNRSPKLAYLTRHMETFAELYLFQRAIHLPQQLNDVLDPEVVREGMPGFLEAYRAWAEGATGGDAADVRQLERDVYMRNMLLRDADWAGMAHGVEIRTPLVDLALHRALCDADNRCGFTKRDLHRLLAKLDPAYGAKMKPKTGFSVPYQVWFDPNPVAFMPRQHSGRSIQSWHQEIAAQAFPGWMRGASAP